MTTLDLQRVDANDFWSKSVEAYPELTDVVNVVANAGSFRAYASNGKFTFTIGSIYGSGNCAAWISGAASAQGGYIPNVFPKTGTFDIHFNLQDVTIRFLSTNQTIIFTWWSQCTQAGLVPPGNFRGSCVRMDV
ncbi:hypothetical protein EUX98_g7259 [Antrodiella citrinella]|uniref:Uncharacterized protein n=1 Tax=Antrodiella citrinella TaxID=2447956 RepID=A0A4S4MM97_9APHY|nr:hypothetical protein EUX98_g7259 [Antrodiella citrinella]